MHGCDLLYSTLVTYSPPAAGEKLIYIDRGQAKFSIVVRLSGVFRQEKEEKKL
jgi:hypothetical protein